MSASNNLGVYEQFLAAHETQLKASGVPESFFKAIYNKLHNQIFDGGEYFQLLLLDYGEDDREEKDPVFTVTTVKEIKASDPNAVFLVDHALTFKPDILRKQLVENPAIVNRLSIMMGLPENDDVEKVIDNIWRFSNFYSINAQGATVEDSLPVWYINDELGSAINHSYEPNFRLIPFIYTFENVTYSLLFPLHDVEEGAQVTRDYAEGVEKDRDLILLPWLDSDFSDESFDQYNEPDKSYFLQGRIEESLPENTSLVPVIDNNRPLKVFSDYEFVNQYLTDPAFEVLGEDGKSGDADILWLTKHFKGFNELSKELPNTFVNQFPFENVVTIKDLLAVVCRRSIEKHHDPQTLNTFPEWLPTTYNLKTELKEFVSYFQNREAKGLDNHWIIKPWNLARSLDTHITSSLSQIVRLSQTSPKIVQKYVESPVLFDRPESGGKVKFDVRYVILLTSCKPLVAHVYRNFFLRFSNIPFSMDEFDVYEKHFTVMNYGESLTLKHLKCEDFVNEWGDQYEGYPWQEVEDKIVQMLKQVFVNATSKEPPSGIAHNPQSRGLYAADVILGWEGAKIQPKLLEINFIPDCKRACEYYNDFYNDIFKLLFLGQENPEVFIKIA